MQRLNWILINGYKLFINLKEIVDENEDLIVIKFEFSELNY